VTFLFQWDREEKAGSQPYKDKLEMKAYSPVLQAGDSEQGMKRLQDNGQTSRDLQEQ
jgi:hypothetical protein